MKPKIYIETTIISYLTGRPSRDIIIAAHQQITGEWWRTKRHLFELYASQLVFQEVGAGDEEQAGKRLNALEETELLEITESAYLVDMNPLSFVLPRSYWRINHDKRSYCRGSKENKGCPCRSIQL